MIKLLAIGDSPTTPTGFSRVLSSILKYLPKEDYDIVWLAAGYNGDPHRFPYKLYPSTSKNRQDFYGLERLEEIYRRENPDLVFIVNDAWIIHHFLEKFKSFLKEEEFPKVITYSPVDARDHDPDWYQHFSLCKKVVLYNTFGQNVVKLAAPELETSTISHGVDSDVFYKMDESRLEIRKRIYKNDERINNAFIVFSGARNQPRKKLDIALTAFAIFAQDKPDAMLYMHCGPKDMGIDIPKFANRLGIADRIIMTTNQNGPQRIPESRLNEIYNMTDIGLNTSLGEGWCLPSMEHAVTGAPQIVPNHSALHELYIDCGLLVNPSMEWVLDNIMTTGLVVYPENVAEKLDKLYYNKDLYKSLSEKSISKFTAPEFSWENISHQWDEVFKSVL